MSFQEILKEAETKMDKALEHLTGELRGIRTGRATPALIENIRAEYYGTMTPLNQMAAVSIPEARMILLKPFDPTVLGAMEKAILASSLGVTPQNDGKVIRLAFPALSEEQRRKFSGVVKEQAEKCRVAIRNLRRDSNKQADEAEKSGQLTEDEAKKLRDKIQETTHKSEQRVDEIQKRKTEEIMTI